MQVPEFCRCGHIKNERRGMGLSKTFCKFIDEQAEADLAVDII